MINRSQRLPKLDLPLGLMRIMFLQEHYSVSAGANIEDSIGLSGPESFGGLG